MPTSKPKANPRAARRRRAKMVKLTLELPAELHRQAVKRARVEDRSLAALFRWALRAYIDGAERDEVLERLEQGASR